MLVPRTKSTRLVLPRGVAGSSDEPPDADEGTLSYDVATGLIRIKTSLGWVDATGGGGGGGGGVTSFNTRTGAVVPQAGDYTPALVGLGSVTNNPQWASAIAAQISALTAKTSLADADVIPIEDSAAGFTKKYITAAAFRADTAPTNMFLRPPTTPGALDDEFQYGASAPFGGSADLATRGWTVTNDGGAAMTRVGDVTINYPAALTNVQYRSTMTPSGLLIQSVFKMNVSKALTGSAAFTCDIRPNHLNTDGAYFIEAPMMWDVVTPKLDNTMRRVFVGNFSGNRYISQMNLSQFYTTIGGSTSTSNTPNNLWWAWLDWDQAANNHRGMYADPIHERIHSPNMSVNNFVFTMRSAGFGLQTARAWSNSWVTVRSFRQLTQGKLPFIP